MSNKLKITAEQRSDAIVRLLRNEDTAQSLAQELGVSERTIYQWRVKFVAAGIQALEDSGREQNEVKRLIMEVAERDRTIAEINIATHVLKKIQNQQN